MLDVSLKTVYLVLPAYANAYCHRIEDAQVHFHFPVRFWPGHAGGGIVSHPAALSHEEAVAVQEAFIDGIGTLLPYGTALGNSSAMDLRQYVRVVQAYDAPDLAVRLGLGTKLPRPSVGVTVEHVQSCGNRRFLLVVPQMRRRRVPLMEEVPSWFAHFGVRVGDRSDVPAEVRCEIRDWFDDPERTMYAFDLTGGEDDAAWQFAVLTYVAEHWDVNARGLHSVHLLATIETRPNFRKYWTSNR